MSSYLARGGRRLATKGIYVQLAVSILLVLSCLLSYDEYLIDVIFGCASFLLPHSFFAYWLFRYAGATKANLVVQSFNQGIKVKLMLTILLFIIAFSQFNAHPIPLLGAYAIIMVSQSVAMFRFK